MTAARPRLHSRLPRGMRAGMAAPRSRLTQGRFGRMFGQLEPSDHTPAELRDLGALMVADEDAPHEPPDAEENPGIEAAYTYLGQFIDHDLTFDPNSITEQITDPDALVDFRTPRFDLDSMYGRGPADQPYLYAADGVSMMLGRKLGGSSDEEVRDLPRTAPDDEGPDNPARALIGDPRNDENRLVSQLHATMLRFHNKLASGGGSFDDVRREVLFHYQWVVLHDFLPKIIGADRLQQLYPGLGSGRPIDARGQLDLRVYHPTNNAFMPLEFSGAAYRFGHSMIRPDYRINETVARQNIFRVDGPASPQDSLAGFRRMPDEWGVDWRFLLELPESKPLPGGMFLQHSYKIDTSLVDPLGHLPSSVASEPPPSLAARNLIRGSDYHLPSGQRVARALGLSTIHPDDLVLGKVAAVDDQAKWKPMPAAFRQDTPLWTYVLCEAMQPAVHDGKGHDNSNRPVHLGPVGGTIVGEVFLGLLAHDRTCYLRSDPQWTPNPDLASHGRFGLAELIKAAIT